MFGATYLSHFGASCHRTYAENGPMKNALLANWVTYASIAFRMMNLTSEHVCLSDFVCESIFQSMSTFRDWFKFRDEPMLSVLLFNFFFFFS